VNLNPFALKELRQLTRSRTISGALILFLFASVLATYLIPLGGISHDTGAGIALYLQFALSAMFAVVLPINLFVRMVKERRGKNAADLTLVTPLPPSAVIDGKLTSAFALMFLFTAAAMPFGVASYLLHGVTFVQMVKSAAFVIVAASVVVSVALAIASIRCSPVLRVILFSLFMLFCLQTVLVSSFGLTVAFGERTESLLVALCAMASVTALARASAVAMISPKVMERDASLRITVLVLAVGWFGYVFLRQGAGGATAFLDSVEKVMALFMCLALALAVRATAQDAGYSVRQLAARPASRVLRVLAWPFRSGAVNGLFFALVLGLAVTSVLPLMRPYFNEQFRLLGITSYGKTREVTDHWSGFVFFAYVMSMLLYGRFLWYVLLRRMRLSPVLATVISLFALGLLQTVPSALEVSGCSVACETLPFILSDLEERSAFLVVPAAVALAAGLLLTLPEAVSALRQRLRPARRTPFCREI